MKNLLKINLKALLLFSVVFAFYLGVAQPVFALNLTKTPLATNATSTVKPNILFVFDDSGSMSWDHMPDDDSDAGSDVTFQFGYYGLRSSQCNQVYYDPTYNYLPPLDENKAAYASASFTAALSDGFNAASTAINLNTGYKASQSLNGDATGQSAYYYEYVSPGAETTQLKRNYNSTSNNFYNECHDSTFDANGNPLTNAVKVGTGGAPSAANRVFIKRRLASSNFTTVVINGGISSTVTGITINSKQIMKAATTSSSSSTTLAGLVRDQINFCTASSSGNCTIAGYSATASGNTVTINAPAAAGVTYADTYTPVVTSTGPMTYRIDNFPYSTAAADLQNFANWYSYYRTRILMMKTATSRAFAELDDNYRVGLMKISETGLPAQPVDTFSSTHRQDWYNELKNMTVGGSTPLRRALSEAGRYYAGELGGTDPLQHSCQQNFAILSTDGYWNTGDGYQKDGSSAVGNQDFDASRPMYDGASGAAEFTTQYTQNTYSLTTTGCSGGKKKIKTQPQKFSCSVVGTTETCTTPVNNGSSSSTACLTSPTLPTPNPSARVADGATVPGNGTGSEDSLSDVAMYYYKTDLRPGTCTLCKDNVFKSGNDNNEAQHMTTFTLGLGASGWMNYSSSYLSDSDGDFVSVRLGSTASSTVCNWQTAGTACNWPLPGMSGSNGLIANIDDLWHSAVNGRGAYFSATNPETLSSGLGNALASINARKGAGAAAATSTLNPVANNNLAYVASYTTAVWKGNLEARGINTETGVVSENATWCVENVPASTCDLTKSTVETVVDGNTTTYNCVTPNSVICSAGVLEGTDCKVPMATACTGKLQSSVNDYTDTRKIWTKGPNATTLNNFKLTADGGDVSASDFSATKLAAGLNQWSSLDATQRTKATAQIVNYLRGQQGYDTRSTNDDGITDNRIFRFREATLGDAVESQPAYVGASTFSYLDTGYSAFKASNATRAGTVYMGANDGMMHAFDASTNTDGSVTSTAGQERWAYVPSMLIPNMWELADTGYPGNHRYFANGSPIISDVYYDSAWHTILVAGLNGGGRGYYALDITNPATPTLLWEFSPVGSTTTDHDANLGYSYGAPVITKLNDGTWVVLVTSGYNNIPEPSVLPNITTGDGKGYLYVLNAKTGSKIKTIGTGVGDTTTPSGLAQISAWADEAEKNNTATFVYGGDLLGNIWRFDINAAAATGSVAAKFAILKDSSGTVQPITTKPELGSVSTSDGKTHRVIFVGTGKYLESSDLTTTQQQTLYAIKDDDVVGTTTPTPVLDNPRTATTNPGKMVQQTIDSFTSTRKSHSPEAAVDFLTNRGWYVNFPDSGERQNVPSQLVLGTLIVPTLVPSATVCEAGGTSWLNFFNYKTGGAVDGASGLVSVKVSAPIVGINVIYIPDPLTGKVVPKVSVVTAANPTPELNPDTPFSNDGSGFQKKRAIWRELVQ